MKLIVQYFLDYFKCLNKKLFFSVSILVALLVFVNYYYHLNNSLQSADSFLMTSARFLFLYSFIFHFAYLLHFLITKQFVPRDPFFIILLIISPAIFAVKVAIQPGAGLFNQISFPWNYYLQIVLAWPLKSTWVCGIVTLIWFAGKYPLPVSGLSNIKFNISPYIGLLICMIPLLAAAGTNHDFLETYPKLKTIAFLDHYSLHRWAPKFLYELAYGSDFFTIEFFFRGFLVLAFTRYVGKDAILPMAAFYCTIHFGKPLGECITSYFGGIILGIIVYNTRSIWGGLIVHLGVAWLMEVAGYIGNYRS